MTAHYLYVRYSTTQQAEGDSLARQRELGAAWATRHGVTITREYADEGASGYHAVHRRADRRGGLAEFMRDLRAGQIPRGSVLLLENLDRLSRETPVKVLTLLDEVVTDRGVLVRTLAPEVEYTAATLATHSIHGVVAETTRSHSESAAKAGRSTRNWGEMRKRAASGEVVSRKIPGWLRVVGQTYDGPKRQVSGGRFELIPERAEVIRRIFELARKGLGAKLIGKRLTSEGHAPWSGSPTWQGYIDKVLRMKQVTGEWQPRILESGKLIPTGEPIRDYYPAVVSPEEYAVARAACRQRHRSRSPGRASASATNLFRGLVAMNGHAAVPTSKNGVRYLRPADDTHPGCRIDHLERVVLWWLGVVSLDLDSGGGVAILREREKKLTQSIDDTTREIEDNEDTSLIPLRRRWLAEREEVRAKIEQQAVPAQRQHLRSQALIQRLDTATPDERATLRTELRHQMRGVIASVTVDPPSAGRLKRKTWTAWLTLSSGEVRGVWWDTQLGRVLSSGVATAPHSGGGNRAGLQTMADHMAEGLGSGPSDPVPFRRPGHAAGKHPTVTGSAAEVRARVVARLAEGVPAAQVAVEAGLSERTVFRYAKQARPVTPPVICLPDTDDDTADTGVLVVGEDTPPMLFTSPTPPAS